MIAGLEELSGGELYMNGRVSNQVPCGERNVAMVFQNYALYPHMTVERNITYGLQAAKLPAEEISERLEEVLEMLDLKELRNRKPKELSGGQRQRVALAAPVMAFSSAPPACLLKLSPLVIRSLSGGDNLSMISPRESRSNSFFSVSSII